MITVSVRLESGLFKQAAFQRSIAQVVTAFSFAVEARAKISIQQGKKSGRLYRRKAILKKVVGAKKAQAFSAMGLRRAKNQPTKFVVGSLFHRASAPGQPPASDTAHLANSIIAAHAVSDARGIHANITVGALYGRMLEMGTRNMMPRPFIGPALRKENLRFQTAVNNVVAAAVR